MEHRLFRENYKAEDLTTNLGVIVQGNYPQVSTSTGPTAMQRTPSTILAGGGSATLEESPVTSLSAKTTPFRGEAHDVVLLSLRISLLGIRHLHVSELPEGPCDAASTAHESIDFRPVLIRLYWGIACMLCTLWRVLWLHRHLACLR